RREPIGERLRRYQLEDAESVREKFKLHERKLAGLPELARDLSVTEMQTRVIERVHERVSIRHLAHSAVAQSDLAGSRQISQREAFADAAGVAFQRLEAGFQFFVRQPFGLKFSGAV